MFWGETLILSANLLQLCLYLGAWPLVCIVASEPEVHYWMSKHVIRSEVVPPGTLFVRRIISQLVMSPVRPWVKRFGVSGVGRRRSKLRVCVHFGLEVSDDIWFWSLLVQWTLRPEEGSKMSVPLFSLYF